MGTRDRVVAGAVDVTAALALVLGLGFSPSLPFKGVDFSPAAAFAGAVLAEIYAGVELLGGASPGKRLRCLSITRLDRRPAPQRDRATRWFLKHLPLHALLLTTVWLWMRDAGANDDATRVAGVAVAAAWALAAVSGFGYFLIFDGLHQALHDILTNTAVVGAQAFAAAPNLDALDLTDFRTLTDDPAAAVRPAVTLSPPPGADAPSSPAPGDAGPDAHARPGHTPAHAGSHPLPPHG